MIRVTEISAHLCSPDMAMDVGMERLNTLAFSYLIVVDPDMRPLGTVTDGDIRRAILAGAGLSASIDTVMNSKPRIVGRDEIGSLQDILQEFRFVPVIDEDGKLCEILHFSQESLTVKTALVMAGGFGRRLGEKTKTLPKPLIEVGEKPILEHILSWLEASNVSNVFVSTHYRAHQIQEFVENRDSSFQVEIIHEQETLGTAGALANLPQPVRGPILVINGDVLTKLDLDSFVAFHETHNGDCTMAVTPYEVSIPFGVVKQNADGAFEGIEEKPSFTYFVAAGIYLLEPRFCNLVAASTKIDMPDLINLGKQAGFNIGLFPIHEYWIDIGRPNDLLAAERDHLA